MSAARSATAGSLTVRMNADYFVNFRVCVCFIWPAFFNGSTRLGREVRRGGIC